MPDDTTVNYKVFIGSPSDLDAERRQVRRAFSRWNAEVEAGNQKPNFTLVDSSLTAPTLNRAQSEINKLLRECNFSLILFKESWGTDPERGGPYSSGTEEEFFTSLLSILDKSSPMANTAVFFVEHPNPDPKVRLFKTRLRESYRVYYGNIESGDVESQTLKQLEHFLSSSMPVVPDGILTSRGHNVISPFKKMEQGRQLISLGCADRGLQFLESAAEEGGIPQQIELAKYYRRNGAIERALRHLEEKCWPSVVDQDLINSAEGATVLTELANIDLDRENALKAVLRNNRYLADYPLAEIKAPREFARLLDCTGRAYHQLNKKNEERLCYLKAEELRKELNDPEQTMLSLINLARLDLMELDFDSLTKRLSEAGSLEVSSLSSGTKANFHLLQAQVSFHQFGDFEKSLEFAKMSLEINEFEINEKGIVYSLAMIVQAELALDRVDSARCNAERGLAINKRLKNNFGIRKFEEYLNEITKAT